MPTQRPGSSSSSKSTVCSNISVAVRIRPGDNTYQSDVQERVGEFSFGVYQIGQCISLLGLESCKASWMGTIFAYGQTGSGKTFSMQGTATDPGIIPNSCLEIFSLIEKSRDRAFVVKVSYLEIYNEQIRDLLDPSIPPDEIRLRQDKKRVYASPLTEIQVSSAQQITQVLDRGASTRRTAATTQNDLSSRSHAVLNVLVESRETTITSKRGGIVASGVRTSMLSLIDLAGSERADKNEERRKEGAYINKSLLTLGTVIARLSSPNNTSHIPFRDSKLTRLLQYSLSGNALVSVLATISDSHSSLPESFNTLKFASRIKYIPSKSLERDEQCDVGLSEENKLLKSRLLHLEQTLQVERHQHLALLKSASPTIHSQDLNARIAELEDQIKTFPSPHLLKEKDLEIAELKAELDDRDTIISALRRANRKRELAELTSIEGLFSPDKDSKKRRFYLVQRRSVS